MKKAYILIGAVMYSILGCNGAGKAHLPGTKPLSIQQMDKMRTINSVQASALAAAKMASGAAIVADPDLQLADEKADEKDRTDKLVKLLKAGNCAQTYEKPQDRFDVSWRSEWHVSSENCPINLAEVTNYVYEKSYNKAGEQIRSVLTIQTPMEMNEEFQIASGLTGHQKRGELERKRKTDGSFEVSGQFEFDSFRVANVGTVNARISVLPVSNGGTIRLAVGTSDTVANVDIKWTKSGKRTIIVNGTQILDEKTLGELFSSFELLELLEKIKKMM